jgi:superfamily I DNA/RNA helicase
VIKKNLKQYDKTVRSFREENGKITIFGNNTEMDEAANLIDLISKMKNSGKIQSR